MILAVSISSYSVIKRSFAVIGFVGVDGVWLLTELCVMAVFSCLILSLSLFSLSSRNGVFSSKSSDIPVYDRDTFGKMVIVYSGSRTKWWTAKCAWIIVATFLYFFLCWILLLINCLLYGGQFTLSVSPYMSDIFLLMETVPPDQWNVCHVLLLMPPLIASSFGILQMLLTLWFRPIICFLISAILMLASAYFCVPVLILNYAFCIRSNEILVDGFSFPSGIVYALALSLLCMFIGRHRFRNFDLY